VKPNVLPISPTAASAGYPGGTVVVEITCADSITGTAAISACKLVN
jgi:hypothetical protein